MLDDSVYIKIFLKTIQIKGDLDKKTGDIILRFGDLRSFLMASTEDLSNIIWLKKSSIIKMKTLLSIYSETFNSRKYTEEKSKKDRYMKYLKLTGIDLNDETIRIIVLNKDNSIINDFIMCKGNENHIVFYVREIIKKLLTINAYNIVTVHHMKNFRHFDKISYLTNFQKLFNSCTEFEIFVHDHILICEDKIISFVESGLLNVMPTED